MNNSATDRVLALLNILILVVLLADTFVFQPKQQVEIFDHYKTIDALSSETGTHEYYINYIYTVSGKKIREPYKFNYTLNPGDTFHIERSAMFNRPLNMVFKTDEKLIIASAGILNEGFMGIAVLAFIFIVSIINIFPKPFIQSHVLNKRLLYCGTSFLVVAIFFYFY